MMKIKDILESKGHEVITINMNKTVHDAIKVLVEHNIGALLVLDDKGELQGIISERDILRESAERSHLLKQTKVKDIMTRDLIIGLPDDDIEYTMGIMTQNRIRHLPILENDKIVGMISIGDVVKAQLTESEYTNRYLKQYMFGH
ncbi:MAG: CBS domain-containing protein [Calditrichaeota bacterium]|nr:MAG: CBS domain-containing protein [Calditrichota bacterium]